MGGAVAAVTAAVASTIAEAGVGEAVAGALASGLVDAGIGAAGGALVGGVTGGDPGMGAIGGALTGGAIGGFGGLAGDALGGAAGALGSAAPVAGDVLAGAAGGALGGVATGGDPGMGALTGAGSGLIAGLGTPGVTDTSGVNVGSAPTTTGNIVAPADAATNAIQLGASGATGGAPISAASIGGMLPGASGGGVGGAAGAPSFVGGAPAGSDLQFDPSVIGAQDTSGLVSQTVAGAPSPDASAAATGVSSGDQAPSSWLGRQVQGAQDAISGAYGDLKGLVQNVAGTTPTPTPTIDATAQTPSSLGGLPGDIGVATSPIPTLPSGEHIMNAPGISPQSGGVDLTSPASMGGNLPEVGGTGAMASPSTAPTPRAPGGLGSSAGNISAAPDNAITLGANQPSSINLGGGGSGSILDAAKGTTSSGKGLLASLGLTPGDVLKAGLTGGGLLYSASQGQQPIQQIPQQTALANQLAGISAQQQAAAAPLQQAATTALTTGQLPPDYNATIQRQTNAAKSAIRSQYAQMGLSGSTMEQEALQNADAVAAQQTANTAAQLQAQANGLVTQGMNAAQLAGGTYSTIMQTQMQQDQALSNAVGNFAKALA